MLESSVVDIESSPLLAFDEEYVPEEGEEIEEVDIESSPLLAFDEEYEAVATRVKVEALKRSANYMENEDIAILNAWESISLDVMTANDQSGNKYW
jgi:hypothetical protein